MQAEEFLERIFVPDEKRTCHCEALERALNISYPRFSMNTLKPGIAIVRC
jgi:hypothetical protein